MKYPFSSVAVFLLVATSAFPQLSSHAPTAVAKQRVASATTAVAAPVNDLKPVARVNGTVLTERDLMREIYAIFPYAAQHNGIPKKMEPEMRKGALAMIEFEELVYQEGVRRGVTISSETLRTSEAKLRQKFDTQQAWDEFVKVQFGNHEALREKIRRSLTIEIMMKREITDKAAVTDAQAKAFYDANPKQFDRPETFTIQTISIIPPVNGGPEVNKEAGKRAQDAIAQAKKTNSYKEFGLLAEKMSDDDWHVNMGDRKAVPGTALPPEVVKVLVTMKPGQVTDLIRLGDNYTIVRLNAHDPAGRVKFLDVKAKLAEDLQKSKSEQLRVSLDKKLRQSAKVEEL